MLLATVPRRRPPYGRHALRGGRGGVPEAVRLPRVLEQPRRLLGGVAEEAAEPVPRLEVAAVGRERNGVQALDHLADVASSSSAAAPIPVELVVLLLRRGIEARRRRRRPTLGIGIVSRSASLLHAHGRGRGHRRRVGSQAARGGGGGGAVAPNPRRRRRCRRLIYVPAPPR